MRPNFDTLYSTAWLDLTEEPAVVSVPDTDGRYYLLPMYDMWTDAFAVPGKRTSGTSSAEFVVIPPGWTGSLPDGVQPIAAPTRYVWIIGRTQTNGPDDYHAVHAVQDGFTITPLSGHGRDSTPAQPTPGPEIDLDTPPLDQVHRMTAPQYFSLGAELMGLHPPHQTDWSILARLDRIGLRAGRPFDLSTQDAAIQKAIERAPEDAAALCARPFPGWRASPTAGR